MGRKSRLIKSVQVIDEINDKALRSPLMQPVSMNDIQATEMAFDADSNCLNVIFKGQKKAKATSTNQESMEL